MARYITISILLALWWVGLIRADNDAIWYDEWWTAFYIGATTEVADSSPPDVLERVLANTDHERNPPGYYLLLGGWGNLVGWADVPLRAFSLLAAILTIAITYRLGEDHRVGLAAATILAFSSFFIYYTHEMRTYSLAATFGALTLLGYRRHTPLLLFVGVAGLVYTHYLNALILVPLGVYHLLFAPKNRRWWEISAMVVAAGLTLIPWLFLTQAAFRNAADAGDKLGWTAAEITIMFVNGWTNGLPMLLILLGGFIWQRQRRAVGFYGLLTVGALAVAIGVQLSTGLMNHIRYLLAAWVPFAVLAGLAITPFLRVWRPLCAIVLLLWASWGVLRAFDPAEHRAYENALITESFRFGIRWDSVGYFLRDSATRYDAVAVSAGEPTWSQTGPIGFYLQGIPTRWLVLDEPDAWPPFVAGAGRVWHVRATDTLSGDADFVAMLTEADYVACGPARGFARVEIGLYAVSRPLCELRPQAMATFGEHITLRGQHIDMVHDRLHVWLGWDIDEATPVNTYSVGLQLLDATGALVAQADEPLPQAGYALAPYAIEVRGLPAGDYTLQAVVYDWATGTRLRLEGSEDAYIIASVALQ